MITPIVQAWLANFANNARYLPDPPDAPLWWVPVEYREKTGRCVHFESLV